MTNSEDFKMKIEGIRDNLLEIFCKLEKNEISSKEANLVRRENNKRLKALLKELKQREAAEADKW